MVGMGLSWPVIFCQSPFLQYKKFEKELNQRSDLLKSATREFIKASFYKNTFRGSKSVKQLSDWEKKGLIFLVYEDDSLIFWSDNSTTFPIQSDSTLYQQGIRKLTNGWYLDYTEKKPPFYSISALALVKHDYPYENEYLKNEFYHSFSSSPPAKLNLKPSGFPVKNPSGETLLYYSTSPGKTLPDHLVLPVFAPFLFSFLLLFLFIYHLAFKIKLTRRNPVLFYLAFTALISLTRFVFFWFRVPALLYKSILFSPSFFASSYWLPSLGDLVTNVILLFFLSLLFFRHFRYFRYNPASVQLRTFISIIIVFIVSSAYTGYISAFDVIVSNSSASLTLTDPLTFTYPTILSLLVIVILSASFFIFTLPLYRLLFNLAGRKTQGVLFIFSIITLGLSIHLLELPVTLPIIVYVYYITWLYYIHIKKANPFSLPSLLLQIIVFSLLSTYMILTLDESKEVEQRRLIAQKLSSERDPLAEYLLHEAYTSMQKDSHLKDLLRHYPEKDINEQAAIQYITDHYFGNYWSKYNLDFTLCTPERILNVVIPDNALINCKNYFSELIKMIGKPTLSNNLYFLDYGSGSMNYLAVLPFNIMSNNKTLEITVYVDITSKRIPKGLGYPELLISKESRFSPDINNYSYAIYKKNDLVRSFGKYSYPLNLNHIINTTQRFSVFDINHYNHLSFRSDKDKTIVISLKKRSLLDNIAPFSYFSLLLSLITVIAVLILAPASSLVMKKQTFRDRLQLAMILLILFSFIIIGVTSGIYIVRLNQGKNIDSLTEKAHSILTEIQQKLGKTETLSPDMSNDMFYLLNKFSLVFFSDINLFDLQGNLIASSRPLIFEEGLISTKMNRQSFQELSINQRSLFIHQDKIGNYKFLSAYLPFRNEQDKLIGYLNLPYFARQDEIRSEISSFLVAFVNIYVLLVAFSILIAILISRYITKPMLLLRNKISQVKLGRSNEKIEWRVEDEIGGLVEEYNAMIDKLSFSAEQLARSERESAWREMARQVAHEIKNPLTPMKLSVQLLLKAFDEKEPDWDQRLKRFSQTLIEQIDNLSHIAGSFSDFARMPELKKGKVDLIEVCQSVIELHRDNHELSIITEFPAEISPFIQADRNQVLRVLVNLFKNSLQAIEPGNPGEIRITLTESPGFYELSFTDNGTGIPIDQQSSIFSPNFTTKTGGMGLGLAMVKSIMEEHGGSISFSSKPGQGTTFYLMFPKPGVDKE